MEMKAHDTGDLQWISQAIYEALFEETDIRFHPDLKVVEIPIRREKWEARKTLKRVLFIRKISVPIVRSILSVAHVESYQIEDEAHIGTYDISGVDYHGDSVVISSNFPFAVTLKVQRLEVSLADTDEVFGDSTSWSLFR